MDIKNFVAIGTGLVCISLGTVCLGTAVSPKIYQGTVSDYSTQPAIIVEKNPNRGLLLLLWLLMTGSGLGLIAWGCFGEDLQLPKLPTELNDKSPRQEPSLQDRPVYSHAGSASTQFPDVKEDFAYQQQPSYPIFIPPLGYEPSFQDGEINPEIYPTANVVEQSEISDDDSNLIQNEKINPELPSAPVYYAPTTSAVEQSEIPDDYAVNYTSEEDRFAEVRSLVEEGALLIVGGKGSGKTEKLCWIMASHCKQGHWVWFIDPFAPASRYRGLRVFGRGLNFQEVAEGLREFVEEAKKRIRLRGIDPNYDPFNQIHIHLAIDEMSNYGEEIARYDDTVMQKFWDICTQFLRQANMSVSMVSHGDTQAMMGGEKSQRGKSKAIKRDLIRIYCQWEVNLKVKGGRSCAGWAHKVTVEAGDNEITKKISIPKWMVGPPNHDYQNIALIVNVKNEPQKVQGNNHDSTISHSQKELVSAATTATSVSSTTAKTLSSTNYNR